MIKVILCKSYTAAKEAAKKYAPVCAVETEYGDEALTEINEGCELALVHHGKFSSNKCPSERWDLFDRLKKGYDNFVVSHIDADTLFGILWASKILHPTKITKRLGELVALQDLNGFHYMEANVLPKLDKKIKNQFLAIGYVINSFKFDTSREVNDISHEIHKLCLKIKDIICDGPSGELISKMQEWLENRAILAREALVETGENYRLFSGKEFYLSNYYLDGKLVDVIVQYNTHFKSIALAVTNEKKAIELFGEKGVITPLQEYFGNGAGGHIAIGGSPREENYSFEIALGFVEYLKEFYNLK